MVKKVEPFEFQKSTNIDEHNQMVGKINELVGAWNEGDVFVTPAQLNTAIAESSADDIATAKKYTDDEIAKLPAKGFVTTDDLETAKYVTEDTMKGADKLVLSEAKGYTNTKLESYPTKADVSASESALHIAITSETEEALTDYYLKTEVDTKDAKVASDAERYVDNAIIPLQTKELATTQHAELSGRLTAVEAEADALTKEIPNALAILDGTTTYEVKVRMTLESGETIESNLKNLGQMVNLAVKQSEAVGQFYVQFESTDGRTVRSNDFIVNPNVVADSYITSVTFVPNYTTGYLSAEIGLSNGTKFNANEILVPTDPAIKTAIETMQSDIASVSQRVTVLENGATADNVTAQTLSVTNSVLKSIITLASGKTIEATTTLPETDISALVERLDGVEATADTALTTANTANTKANEVATRIASTDATVTGHATRLTAIETKNNEQDTDITAIETDIVAIKNKNTSQDTSITDLTNRMAVAEVGIDNNEVIDATLTNDANGLKLTIGTGKGGVESNVVKVGGEEWEELDITNLPTDFISSDELKILFRKLPIRRVNGADITRTEVINVNVCQVYYVSLFNNSAAITLLTQHSLLNNCISNSVTGISTLGASDFNGSTPITFRCSCIFTPIGTNKTDYVWNTVPMTRDNITDYVTQMWRKRA